MSEVMHTSNNMDKDASVFDNLAYDGMTPERQAVIATKRGDRRSGLGTQIPHEIKSYALRQDISTALGRWALNS